MKNINNIIILYLQNYNIYICYLTMKNSYLPLFYYDDVSTLEKNIKEKIINKNT